MIVYIGTSTNSASRGIYALNFDSDTGELSDPWVAAEAENPTFLALSPGRRCLYATGGSRPADPPLPPGIVSAFSIDPSGRLGLLNSQPSGAGNTTYVAIDATGRAAIAANYHGGSICAFPVLADGRLGARGAAVEPRGPLGPNRSRQAQPHPHSVTLSPDNRFVLACDLGLDRVFVYRIEPAAAALAPHSPPSAAVAPGAGPRHSKFSADGRHFYVANELDSSVCVFAWGREAGALDLRQTKSTLPSGFAGESSVAEIRVHPTDRFVYVSNRGHDSIAVFGRDPGTGALRAVDFTPSGGGHPRNFALSPDGRWLLCANRDSGNLVLFRIDAATGRLSPAGPRAAVPEPVCVLFGG